MGRPSTSAPADGTIRWRRWYKRRRRPKARLACFSYGDARRALINDGWTTTPPLIRATRDAMNRAYHAGRRHPKMTVIRELRRCPALADPVTWVESMTIGA